MVSFCLVKLGHTEIGKVNSKVWLSADMRSISSLLIHSENESEIHAIRQIKQQNYLIKEGTQNYMKNSQGIFKLKTNNEFRHPVFDQLNTQVGKKTLGVIINGHVEACILRHLGIHG